MNQIADRIHIPGYKVTAVKIEKLTQQICKTKDLFMFLIRV
ncbi:hypothetical protein [Caldisphaera sp.]